jgi:hypothetical protein
VARVSTKGCGVHHGVGEVRGTNVIPRVFDEENPSPCTLAIVSGSVVIAYRSHHKR